MSNGSGRAAIVIGGASGIGWATARALAADGCRVTVADRNAAGARGRAGELGAPHTAAEVDVTDEESVQRLFDQAGALDVVVNCAGFSNVGMITDMPVADFRAVVDVCLTGAFIVAKHAGRALGTGGVLVSISSLNGRQPAIPGVVDDYVDNTALGRAGTPEDIAGAVCYLCSPASSWVTGEVLDINGGAHLKKYPDVMGHVMKLAAQ